MIIFIKKLNMKTIYLLLSLLFYLFFVNKTTAQWVQTNGPLGGRVYCVERVGNQIWAGTNIGIYASDNEGLSWQKSSLINGKCIDISSKNDTVLILFNVYEPDSFYNYVFYSIVSFNGGNTWSSPIYAFTPFGGFWPRLQRVQNSYIFTDSYYYWITHDYGINWSMLDTSIVNGYGFARVIGNHIVTESLDNSLNSYNYRISSDQGYSWQLIYNSTYPVTAYMTDSVFVFGDEINPNPWHQKVMRSINNGASWDSVFVTPIGISMGGIFKSNDSIFIITNKFDTNYFSLDYGLTWNFINTRPIINYLNGDTLNVSNGDYIETSYNDGIIRHNPSQDTLFQTNNGLTLNNISYINSYNNVLYASCNNGKTYYSMDQGQVWKIFNLPQFQQNSSFFIEDMWYSNDTILISTSENLLRSFDSGITWDIQNYPFQYYYMVDELSLQKTNNRLYLSCDSVYYSDDIGITWHTLPPLPVFNDTSGNWCVGNYDISGKIKSFNNSLFIVTNSGYIYKLNTSIDNWEYSTCFWSPGAHNYNTLYSIDNTLILSANNGFIVSNDTGTTWFSLSQIGLPTNEYGSIINPKNLISINDIWIGMCDNSGIYYSNDTGNTWQPLDIGIPPFIPSGGLTVQNGILYSGSYYTSVWRRSGIFYTISGTVYSDYNHNGIQDAGELGMPNIIVKMVTAGTVATTDSNGNYSILTDVTGDTLKPVLPVSFASSSPNSYIINGAASNKDFGIYLTPGIADLSIDLTNSTPFVPGFYISLQLSIINKGSLIQSPNIQLILDTSLTYISSSITPNSIVGNTIQWNTSLLDYMDIQNIYVTVATSTTSTLGDSIQCFSSVNPIINDINTIDNYSVLNEIIIGSYDPNDKTCMQGGYFTPEQAQSNEELEYVIRFQNTGTYLATNIHVSDTLNSYLDFSTFRVISSSHQMNWNISGNAVVDFNFNGINLPPSSQDELNSHGFIKYGIKCKQGISIGNVITNTANIYFDFNPPIITNTTTTAIAYSTLLQIAPETIKENPNISILVYPNPTSEKLNVNISGYDKNDLNLFIYSNSGDIIKHTIISGNLNSIDFTGLSDGIYFGFILNSRNKKIATFKFVLRNH